MAYSDYVQVYNVYNEAGIADTDERAAQVEKIVTWINSKFSDIVTAENDSDVTVVVKDNTVKAGFWWGQPIVQNSTSYPKENYPNCRGKIFYVSGAWHYMTADDAYYYRTTNTNKYTIETLGLFVCRTSKGYVMDFISLTDSSYGAHLPYFMVVDGKYNNGEAKKVALFQNFKDYYTGLMWGSIDEDSPSAGKYTVEQANFFAFTNTTMQVTKLTKFAPLGSNVICDTLYLMDGVQPSIKTIFEIDGSKYLSLNYNAFVKDSNLRCGLALKLD